MNQKVSIIVACYNEEKNIEETIRRISKTLPNAEILVVDGSTDKTTEVSRSLGIENVRVVEVKPDKGKGYAIRLGIKEAIGDIQAQIDADCQFLPEELPRLLKPIIDGEADISLGSRFIKGANIPEGTLTKTRRLANFVISMYTTMLAGKRATDIGAGFKAWTRDAINDVGLTCDHYAYESEIIMGGWERKKRVVEVPVSYAKRKHGVTNVNLFRDGILMPLYLFQLKMKYLGQRLKKKK